MKNIAMAIVSGALVLAAAQLYAVDGPASLLPPLVGFFGLVMGVMACTVDFRD